MERCPVCGSTRLIIQNLDSMTNMVSMSLSVAHQIQVRCEVCQWIGFDQPCMSASCAG